MKVLVTGGTGEVGAYVVRHLVRSGHKCVLFARKERWSFIPDMRGELEFVEGDIQDADRVAGVIGEGRFDAICHLAARLDLDPNEARSGYLVNVLGTLNVLEAARRARVRRVVYASSSVVYGDTRGGHGYPTYRPFSESDPPRPGSAYAAVYGAGKLAGEQLCLAYSNRFELEAFALRLAPALCVGREEGHAALNAHRRVIDAALESVPVSIPVGGDEKVDIVDGRDVARAFELACSAPYRADTPVLNVSSGQGKTLTEWAQAVREVVPDAEIHVGPGLDFLQLPNNYRVLDPSLGEKVLDYTVTRDLTAMIEGYASVRRLLRASSTANN